VDREAIRTVVEEWLAATAESDPRFDWLRAVLLDVEPASLVDNTTKDGDNYKAGAVRVALTGEGEPTIAHVKQLHDLIVGDCTLGNRAKDVRFEWSDEKNVVGRLVVIPL
jgi:hypothetical protein